MYILRKQNSKNLPILLKGGDLHLKVSFEKEIYDESLRLDTPVVFFSLTSKQIYYKCKEV